MFCYIIEDLQKLLLKIKKNNRDQSIFSFKVIENDTTVHTLRDAGFHNRLFEEFAKIEGLNYLLGLKRKLKKKILPHSCKINKRDSLK